MMCLNVSFIKSLPHPYCSMTHTALRDARILSREPFQQMLDQAHRAQRAMALTMIDQ